MARISSLNEKVVEFFQSNEKSSEDIEFNGDLLMSKPCEFRVPIAKEKKIRFWKRVVVHTSSKEHIRKCGWSVARNKDTKSSDIFTYEKLYTEKRKQTTLCFTSTPVLPNVSEMSSDDLVTDDLPQDTDEQSSSTHVQCNIVSEDTRDSGSNKHVQCDINISQDTTTRQSSSNTHVQCDIISDKFEESLKNFLTEIGFELRHDFSSINNNNNNIIPLYCFPLGLQKAGVCVRCVAIQNKRTILFFGYTYKWLDIQVIYLHKQLKFENSVIQVKGI